VDYDDVTEKTGDVPLAVQRYSDCQLVLPQCQDVLRVMSARLAGWLEGSVES
jgi:hypothetical protein